MLAALLLAAQAAAPLPPDISLHATVTAREVKIRREGQSRIRVWAEPDAGSAARGSGALASRRFELRIDARIADLLYGGTPSPPDETPAPSPR